MPIIEILLGSGALTSFVVAILTLFSSLSGWWKVGISITAFIIALVLGFFFLLFGGVGWLAKTMMRGLGIIHK